MDESEEDTLEEGNEEELDENETLEEGEDEELDEAVGLTTSTLMEMAIKKNL